MWEQAGRRLDLVSGSCPRGFNGRAPRLGNLWLLALVVLVGCEHPLDVTGRGAIVSSTGTRNCAWSEAPCQNLVLGAYQETYTAVPEAGWRFTGWEACNSPTNSCAFNIDAATVEQFYGQVMPDLVANFETVSGSDGDFLDDFTTNSLPEYAVVHGENNPVEATVTWQSGAQRLALTTGDDTAVRIQKNVVAAETGLVQLDYLPTTKYPLGGRIIIRLLQDADNYWLVENSDGYGPGRIAKYVDGALVSSQDLSKEYEQGANYDLNIYFSPSRLTVSGMDSTRSLAAGGTPLVVNVISVTLVQQDAYLDDIGYAVSGLPYLVALGDSISKGVGDSLKSDGIGFPPPLEDRLRESGAGVQLVFNEGISGQTAADGEARVNEVLQHHPAADSILVMYGSNDAKVDVPSGLGLSPGQSGYDGSYKSSMQAIVTSVLAAGKTVILAKAPAKTGSKASENTYLDLYRQVIDELNAENTLSGPSPDFYCYFSAYPGQLPDEVHPDNDGYLAMAGIWRNMLLGWSGNCSP